MLLLQKTASTLASKGLRLSAGKERQSKAKKKKTKHYIKLSFFFPLAASKLNLDVTDMFSSSLG